MIVIKIVQNKFDKILSTESRSNDEMTAKETGTTSPSSSRQIAIDTDLETDHHQIAPRRDVRERSKLKLNIIICTYISFRIFNHKRPSVTAIDC